MRTLLTQINNGIKNVCKERIREVVGSSMVVFPSLQNKLLLITCILAYLYNIRYLILDIQYWIYRNIYMYIHMVSK